MRISDHPASQTILIITDHPLYPIDHGAIVRVIAEAKFLSNNGFQVHLIGADTEDYGRRVVKEITGAQVYTHVISSIRAWASSKIDRIDSSVNLALLKSRISRCNTLLQHDTARIISKNHVDLIQCDCSRFERFLCLPNQVTRVAQKYRLPTVLVAHNVEHVKLTQEGSFSPALFDRLKLIERDLCNSANVIAAMSDQDKNRLIDIGVRVPIVVVPNGVDYAKYQVSDGLRQCMRARYGIRETDIVLVYHGTLRHPANAQANDRLINRIFPEVASKCRNVKLLLIGPKHPNRVGNGIVEMPAVPFGALPKYLSMGDIAVVPLTAGSGTRLKIIEYLALGIPTVSTALGAEGLPVTHGENIVITRDAENDFVEKLVRLIEDKDLQEKISRSGKRLAREKLDWNAIFRTTYSPLYHTLW